MLAAGRQAEDEAVADVSCQNSAPAAWLSYTCHSQEHLAEQELRYENLRSEQEQRGIFGTFQSQ